MTIPKPRTGEVALVTGASTGLGVELADRLAARGHDLVITARREDLLGEVAQRLERDHGVRVIAVGADLADAASRARLLAAVAGWGLEVSVLVNNAGFATGGHFSGTDRGREVEQVRVLVEAVVDLTSAVLPSMVERGRGAVLNVASTAGMQALPYSTGYSAAKAHTITFSSALRAEVAPRGVTVTALCPGPIRTDFWKVAGEQPIKQAMPRALWVEVGAVADAGIRGLERGRRVVVPGAAVRLMALGNGVTPALIKTPVLRRAMRPRATA
ncbi:SDR family NAD(P)-dependent oxidoreductase [Nocardioides montaniterrae]